MANYEYVCHDCRLIWDKEYALAKNPTRTRCPECKKLCEKNWSSSRNCPPLHFKGAGWTGRNERTGLNKKGGSDEINKMLQGKCKDAMAKGYEAYKVYSPSKGYLESVGAKKLNEEQIREKLTASKKMSAQVYDKAKIDPHHRYKPQ